MIDAIGGRKFVFAVLLYIAATIFTAMKLMTPGDYTIFMSVVGATYVIGNVLDSKTSTTTD